MKFSIDKSIKKHIITENRFVCEACKKEFRFKSVAEEHYKETHICPTCSNFRYANIFEDKGCKRIENGQECIYENRFYDKRNEME